jgi:hypothetical protein
LKCRRRCVTILRMIPASIAAFAVVFCASVAFAQQSDLNKLIVIVRDQAGAVIPSAGVRATDESTGRIFDVVADGTGQAILHLPNGNFTVRVQAPGFETWSRAGLDPALQTQQQVTMRITNDNMVCPCVGPPPDVVPEDSVRDSVPAVAAEIPLVPLQSLSLRAKRLRLKAHAG